MIPARPLCEAGRRRIAIVAEPVIRHGLPRTPPDRPARVWGVWELSSGFAGCCNVRVMPYSRDCNGTVATMK